MRYTLLVAIGMTMVVARCLITLAAHGQDGGRNDSVSFKNDVFPVISRACLPCHAEDSSNPSELALDSYEQMMAGGKHGTPIIAGDPEGSLLVKKLGPNPPFGDRMPLQRRKSVPDPRRQVTPEELQRIKDWIAQGAKNN